MSNSTFTNYYMGMMIVTSVLISLFPFIPTFWYFAFSIKLIIHNFQIWRLFTNFLIAPSLKLGIGFIFQMISLYKSLSELEINAKRQGVISCRFCALLALFCTVYYFVIPI